MVAFNFDKTLFHSHYTDTGSAYGFIAGVDIAGSLLTTHLLL